LSAEILTRRVPGLLAVTTVPPPAFATVHSRRTGAAMSEEKNTGMEYLSANLIAVRRWPTGCGISSIRRR